MEIIHEFIEINHVRQSFLTMRTDSRHPVLLIVHGGAGCPDRPLVKKYNKALAEYYTVVCWDQRGCGFSDADGPLSVGLLLSDLRAVVAWLREQYRQDKIYVAGHSWGSYLALRYTAMCPETVQYYIGTGQEVSAIRSEADKYQFVREQARKRNDKRVLRKLEAFGEPDRGFYRKGDQRAKSYIWIMIFRYAGYFSKNGPSLGKYLVSYLKLFVKCYGTGTWKLLTGAARSLMTLNAEMDRKDSISRITELPVPVLLISGEEDMICPVATAQRWFDALHAPKKAYVKIKNAAHMVNFEQPREWNRLLIGLLDDGGERCAQDGSLPHDTAEKEP